jgi:hypothetical protein
MPHNKKPTVTITYLLQICSGSCLMFELERKLHNPVIMALLTFIERSVEGIREEN